MFCLRRSYSLSYAFLLWELMSFHKGRLDWMQPVSPVLKEFCYAALDEKASSHLSRALLSRAAAMQASTTMRISRGQGFLAHLEALHEVVREDEALPVFFADPTWDMMQVLSHKKIKTDSVEGMRVQEVGFFVLDPESLLEHYRLEVNMGTLSIQGTTGQTIVTAWLLFLQGRYHTFYKPPEFRIS
jgi:hypothetical protein